MYKLRAFGSIQDTSARSYLEGYLMDTDLTLKVAAAFSLSQMGDGSKPFVKDFHGAPAYADAFQYIGKFMIAEIGPDRFNYSTTPWAYYRYALSSPVGERKRY